MSYAAPLPASSFGVKKTPEQTRLALLMKDAKRRSFMIKLYRKIIPLLLITFVGATAVYSALNRLVPNLAFGVDKMLVNGSKLSMMAPNLGGYMKGNKAYKVTAERAEQDIKNPVVIDLFKITGEFEQNNGEKVFVKAIEGTMQTDKEIIDFRKNVTVTTTTGHFVSTSSAYVDAKAGTIDAPNFIELKSTTGEMVADSMNLIEGGKIIIFIGNIKGQFLASSASETSKSEEKPQEERKQ